jgi:lipopolysaccharide biosynthesis glycosyltransferase
MNVHNEWYKKYDFVVFDDELSPNQKLKLKQLNDKVKFNKINRDLYSEKIKNSSTPKRLLSSFYLIEGLNLKYDRLIFIDVDILAIGDFSEILKIKSDVVVSDITYGVSFNDSIKNKEFSENEKKPYFSSGLMIFNKLDSSYYDKAINCLPINKPPFGDQPVFNKICQDKKIYFMDNKYHGYKRYFLDKKNPKKLLDELDIRTIHYAGPKPWSGRDTQGGSMKHIEDLWNKYFKEAKNIVKNKVGK